LDEKKKQNYIGKLDRKGLRCLCHFFLRCFFRHPIFCWEQSAGDNCG